MTFKVVFNHGKESGPSGVKINALRTICDELNVPSESIDYRGIEDPEERAEKLLDVLNHSTKPVLLVGSSMGSYVALRAANHKVVLALFLMAPAVYMPGYDNTDIDPLDNPTFVVHGWQDEIVPVENAIRFANEYQKDLLLLADDHVLRHSLKRLCVEFRRFASELILKKIILQKENNNE